LFTDLDMTWELFMYYYNTFSGIKKKLSHEHQHNFNWLRGASGSTGYRWFCGVTGKPEVYDWEGERGTFQAAWMEVDHNIDVADDVYVFDFASLYPTMMRGNNLFSRCKKGEGWHGSGCDVFPSVEENENNGIVGHYKMNDIGKFENELESMFMERKVAKKKFKETGDIKYYYEQLGIKILMNSSYGASGSSPFKSMYDPITAEDITRSAQCCIRHAKKYFEEKGYWIIYLHTDSLYVVDVYGDGQKIKDLAKEISDIQRKALNIPTSMHSFDFEKRIDRLWLTKGDKGDNLKQRNFILYTDYGSSSDERPPEGVKKTGYTGGKLADFNCSRVSKEVWNQYITPDLIDGKADIYYSVPKLLTYIKDLVRDNPDWLIMRKKSKSLDSYKSTTCQPYKITDMYGPGEHFFIPNKYVGVGDSTGKHFLSTMDELKESFGDAWLDAVDYSKYITELKVFIRPEERKEIRKL
ncbi:MAG: DNA polymerase domain-containing protein, partial [Candidatus Thorarchaeota archaeon]